MVPGTAEHYSIEEDFVGQGQAVWDDINLLKGVPDPANKLYQFVDTQIPLLEAAPKNWVLFAKQLAELSEASACSSAGIPPPGFGPQSGVSQQVDSLLTGKDLLLKDLAALQDQVVAETGFLARWTGFWNTANGVSNGLMNFISTHKDYANAHVDKVEALRGQIEDVLAELWELSGLDLDKNKKVSADLDALSSSLSKLLSDAMQKVQVEELISRFTFDRPGSKLDVLSEARRPITNDWTSDSSAETFQNELNRRDRALGLLSYILALMTGLSQNYFGQNFGTVADYVKLILWAFGAKVAVDVLAGGMERWVGSQNR